MSEAARIHTIYQRLSAERHRWYPTSLSHFVGQPFKALIAGMLSARTREEQTDAATARLFALADNPQDMLTLPEETIRQAIASVSFPEAKARHVIGICRALAANNGEVPQNLDALMALPGVGWKVATLTLIIAFGQQDHVCVDTHVDRVSKRLGLVDPAIKQAPRIAEALKAVLPREYWASWNGLMVQFGREVCQPLYPKCRTCPIRDLCPRIGVGTKG